jgi:hypothetical protein
MISRAEDLVVDAAAELAACVAKLGPPATGRRR